MQSEATDAGGAAELPALAGVVELAPERGGAGVEVPAEPDRIRLNIGAGNKVLEGYIAVGLEPQHDVISDVRALPLPDDYADEAICIHVLEHLERWEAPGALREWRRVLKPGGLLVLELPDLLKCCRNVLAGRDVRRGLWGLYGDPGHRDPLMIHRWGWTPSELIAELKEAGFTKVRHRDPQYHGKRNYRDMRIEA